MFFVVAAVLLVSTHCLTDVELMNHKIESLTAMVKELRLEHQSEIKELQNDLEKQRRDNFNLQLQLRKSCHAYNTTVEKLELRVELLEEDLLQAQTTILNLEFYLQETIETVADQGDNISQQEDEIISLETNLNQVNSTVLQLEVTIADQEDQLGTLNENVEGLQTNDDLQNENLTTLEQIHSDITNSVFYASLSENVIFEEPLQRIIFDDVWLNEGDHYNSSTGIYTVPVSGIYEFFALIRANPEANFYILADGETIINPQKHGGVDDWRTNGASGIASLVVGQEVFVETGDRPYEVEGYVRPLTWFHGHLLSPYL